MMWKEFEEIAGYEVSYDDYNNIIEPMYMATNLSKADFVKCIDKKRFALPTKREMIREMRKEAKHLQEICGHWSDYECENRLEDLAHKYLKRFYGIDWATDSQSFAYFNREYEFPSLQRGCTYPVEVVIGRGRHEFERIQLIKG